MYFFFQQYFFYYHMPSSILKSLHFSCYDFLTTFVSSSFFILLFCCRTLEVWRGGERDRAVPIWQRMARRPLALGAKYP